MTRRVADLLVAIALRLYPGARAFDDTAEGPISVGQWAGLMILHAEAVHDCQHTDIARRELGLAGPRGEAVAS